ncbi:MAG: hypothetical protein GC191_00455 [Azospirillum sp.]|nr:hypothetical protein [Azospirillum sp.]
MDVTPWVSATLQLIERYTVDEFRIRGTVHHGPVIVFRNHTEAWTATDFDGLTIDSFAAVAAAAPRIEILLIGCGARIRLLPKALRQALRDAGLVVETMDTGSACRTFNILIAEDRRVAAALLPR